MSEPHHLFVQLGHEFRTSGRPAVFQKPAAASGLRLLGQLLQQGIGAVQATGGIRHQKPFLSRVSLSRFRQRPRMKPIEPGARRKRLAMSR